MQKEVQFWYLRHHKLFRKLDETQIDSLCIISKFKKVSLGQAVYFPDETISNLYLLKKGRIKIAYQNKHGQEIISEVLKEGDIFGELSLSEGPNENKEYAEAMSREVVLCTFTVENFTKMLQKNPELAIEYSKWIGFKFKKVKTKFNDLVFKDLKSRLHSFLKDFAITEGRKSEGWIEVDFPFTHQDLASIVAGSRQSVTTFLNEMEAKGLLVFPSRKVLKIKID